MKIIISLLALATISFHLLAGSMVLANTDSDTTEVKSTSFEAVSAIEKIDQASSVPKSDTDKAKGSEVWGNIYQVLSHPRCVNCHVPDDQPRWSGKSFGKPQVHGMNVHATATRMGIPGQQMCSTCHAKTNADVPHGPPGAEVWMLAPAEMVWWGKSSSE